MRTVSAPRFALLLTLAASIAGAQSNPNLPRAEAYAYSAQASSASTCPYVSNAGATASSNVSASATCSPGAPYAGGTHTASASADFTNGYFSANSSVDGVLNAATNVQAQGVSYAWNYYTISDPASVFRIVLSTSVNGGAAATANSLDYSYAVGYLAAYSVNAAGGYPESYLSLQQREYGAGQYSANQNVTTTCTPSNACTRVTTSSGALATDLLGSDLNSNGIFAAIMEAYAFNASYNSGDSPISVSEASYAYFAAPTVTLYDADGNDITSQHLITSDFAAPVVATPEPAGIVFLATGLISVLGIVCRRRRVMR